MNQKKNIIWLASYPKSGNTWIRIFLQNILRNYEEQSGFPSLIEIPIASNRLLIDKYLGINSSDLSEPEIINFRPEVYRALSNDTDGLRVIKVHDSFSINSHGYPIFPSDVTHYAIYIIRNPLDIVVSYSFHSGMSILDTIKKMNDPKSVIAANEIDLKSQVTQHLGTWSDHVMSWINQTSLPVYITTYELLLADSDGVFRDLLNKLNIPYDNNGFNRALHASDFIHLQNLELSYGFREKPLGANIFFREGRKNIYKDYLTTTQIRNIVDMHHEIMNRFGYLENL